MQWVAMIVAAVLAWIAFPYFLSSSQKWRTSPVAFYSNRFALAVVTAFVAGIILEQNTQPIAQTTKQYPAPTVAHPPAIPSAPNANTEVPPAGTPSSTIASAPPTVATTPISSTGEITSRPESKIDPRTGAVEKAGSAATDIPAIDCERQSAEYQKLVCNDPPLHQQEERIVRGLRAKLGADSSSEVANEIRSKFTEFRATLNDCIRKNCVENEYAEFEKRWFK